MISDFVDTLQEKFKVKPEFKHTMFEDFKNKVVYGVHRRWKRRKLRKPKIKRKLLLRGNNSLHFYYKGYDIFYKKSYPFTAKYGNYSLYYCHYKYRDDYIFITLKHTAIDGKNKCDIKEDILILLESVGINLEYLEIKNKISRIDYKHDFEFENYLVAEHKATMCILKICRDSSNGVYKESLKKGIGIKYKPKSSSVEIIVYDKYNERKDKLKNKENTSHIELELKKYENVFRSEVRQKGARLRYNKKNVLKIDDTLDKYYDEKVAEECFSRFVEPIFYTEPFYRIDYALLAIQTDRRLTEKEAEKLCQLVIDINKKGFTRAKAEYKYSDDTFEKHIKLLRSIGINPLCFDEDIDITFLHNFTTKEVCRDFTINDEEHEDLKQKYYDEYGF